MRLTGIMVVLLTTGMMALGCGSPRMTDTARTGIERLVVSTAAERAVEPMNFKALAGKTVFVDVSQLEGTEKAYALNEIREHLGRAGALMAADKAKADAVAEVRAGALETDSSVFLFGIPAIPIPVPGAGTLTTPELALFKKAKQTGTAKIAINVLDAEGKQLLTTGRKHGASFFTRWTLLILVNFETTDIPEAKVTWY